MYHAWAFALSIVFCLVLLIEAGCKEDSMNCGDQSNRYAIHPYPGLVSTENLQVNRNGTSINVTISSIVNDTQYGAIYVIVLGKPTCNVTQIPNQWKVRLNMTNSQEGWIAANFTDTESIPPSFLIGEDPTDNSSTNCRLHPDETYRVVVAIIDRETANNTLIIVSKPIHPTTYEGYSKLQVICFSVFPLIGIGLVLIFVLRWKYKQISTGMKTLRSRVTNNHVSDTILLPIAKSSDEPLNCYSQPIEIEEFEGYVKGAIEKGELESQFKMLPVGMVKPFQCGSSPRNKSKNRDQSLIAYDETRVILSNSSSRCHTDYINANYVQGYCKEKAYIATQGPMSETVVDFWRMIWQEEARIICMMVNVIEGGKKMCEQYWPEDGKTVEYGDICILNLKQTVYADHIHRIFQLTSRSATESRKVHHLQYKGWPEQVVPMYSHSIVGYLNELRSVAPGPGPVVVHCSSGNGRTGTIILCDIILRHAAAEGTIDVFTEAKKMYAARANMLDNVQQYVLAHLLPTQCLLLLSTKLSCSEVTPQKIEKLKEKLPIYIERLASSSWMDKALRPSERLRPPNPNHMMKNRFPKLTPVEQRLVTLQRYPSHDLDSDYIAAVNVDGVRIKNQFIASQLPLPTTFSDFWRLIAEKRVELVIILQRHNPGDSLCVDVIPRKGKFFTPVPYLKVEYESSSNYSEHFTTEQLLLTDMSAEKTRFQTVIVLTCNDWNLRDDVEQPPPPPEALVALWSVSEAISRADSPTLVLCGDGVTGCGLYLALSFLLERMAVEQECDVILAVRAIRRSRPEFVISEDQFKYLYDAAVKFLEGFETYSNFS